MINLRAMVLAAGVGSRLQPLSDIVPKPMLRIGGKPIMEHILLLLKRHGVTDVVSNTHHLAGQIEEYFADAKQRLGINLKFVYEEQLSGVAGGIRKCRDFFEGHTSCIIMGDALTDINLTYLYQKHMEAVKKHKCLVSIAQMQTTDTSQFGVIVSNKEGKVVQFQEKPKPEDALSNWVNTGIYFFEPEVLDHIPKVEEAEKYDVGHDLFPKLLKLNLYIQAISIEPNSYWADIGTPEQYIQSMIDIAENKVNLDFLPLINPNANIDGTVKLLGVNEIGPSCTIERNSILKNSIIWDNVLVGEGCCLENCILGSFSVVEKNTKVKNKIFIDENKYTKIKTFS